MKTILTYILIMLTVFAFSSCTSKQKAPAKTANFDWLLGKWQRINEEQGKITFESWEKISDTDYRGIGFTLQNNDTLSQEKMKISATEGKWYLGVKTPDEPAFIKFEMSDIKEGSFECKNDTLDFPKRIQYWKNGDHINALVSGDSLELSFEFKRILRRP